MQLDRLLLVCHLVRQLAVNTVLFCLDAAGTADMLACNWCACRDWAVLVGAFVCSCSLKDSLSAVAKAAIYQDVAA